MSNDCSKGPHGPIGSWDVSDVTDMSYLFLSNIGNANPLAGANKFNADLSKWVVSSVTNMGRMFEGATKFNADLSKWVTS